MRTPPLRKRVIASSLGVLALAFVLLDAAIYVALDRHLRANLEEALEQRVAITAELAAELAPDDLVERLTRLGIRATVSLPGGRQLRTEPAVPRTKPGLPLYARGLGDDLLSRELPGPGGTRITVGVSRAGVTATMHQLLLTEVAATALALCLAAGLLARTTASALRPIHALATTARRISSGQHDDRLRPDRPDTDLGAMACAFDHMVGDLASAVREAHGEMLRASAAEERSRRFLADAAHQLRTPITAISTSVDTLLRARTDAARERALGHLVAETDRSVHLVHDLLTLARLDEPAEAIPAGAVEVVAAARTEVARYQATGCGVALRLQVHPGAASAAVVGDLLALREALSNVLDNAVRHARAEVVVGVRVTGRDVLIDVGDDGPGVPEHLRALVFERFSTHGLHAGTGLGLAIARAIARRHGGELACVPEGFRITLPRARGYAADRA